ncbi:MAG: hypothetical protein WCV99_24995 [Sterolibacterium sp.]|jgi:hypothetical protein
MDELAPVPSYELSELLAALKPYQASALSQLLEKHGEEEAAELWLSATGPSNTQRFGGAAPLDSKPFWNKFSEELRLFICGDKKYKKERDKLLSEAKPASLVLVSGISGLLGSTLGFAPSLLAPAVAMMLFAVGKVGVNAWCKCG